MQVVEGLKEAVNALERKMIRDALNRNGGILARAAKELHVSERVLRYKVQKYGLKKQTILSDADKSVDVEIVK